MQTKKTKMLQCSQSAPLYPYLHFFKKKCCRAPHQLLYIQTCVVVHTRLTAGLFTAALLLLYCCFTVPHLRRHPRALEDILFYVRERERERESERERERERDRQTDRQTERKRERNKRETERQRAREREIESKRARHRKRKRGERDTEAKKEKYKVIVRK